MPEKVVVESTPLASQSPWIDMSVHEAVYHDSRFTHIRLELNKLKTTAVHFDDVHGLLLLLGLVGIGPVDN
jgi:hypothetical protein